MTISVVLLTYKRPHVLPHTIESILSQTMSDFELIVMDDCSDDSTPDVVDPYVQRDPRVSYHRNARRLGLTGNLNAGIELAKHDLIADLHDGDVYDRRLLQRWAEALEACPRAGFVFNAYAMLDEAGDVASVDSTGLPPCFPGSVLIEKMFRGWRFGSPVWGTVMARRSAYEEVGPFRERFSFWSDVDMWFRIAERFDVAYVDEPLIGLPHRKVLPRGPMPGEHEELRYLEQIYLEARKRHFESRPVRRSIELARHWSHVFAARSYKKVTAAVRVLRGRKL